MSEREPRRLRQIPPEVQSTHWFDGPGHLGCWSEHRDCAILRVELLTNALRETLWMARRYADGRMTFAASTVNEVVRGLMAVGIEVPTPDGTPWARDGGGRAYDRLTDEEAALGREPDWWERNEEIARLRAALAEIRATYGRVCDEYELCEHVACASSYGAWATADAALGQGEG